MCPPLAGLTLGAERGCRSSRRVDSRLESAEAGWRPVAPQIVLNPFRLVAEENRHDCRGMISRTVRAKPSIAFDEIRKLEEMKERGRGHEIEELTWPDRSPL